MDLIDREQALKDYQDKLCKGVSCVDCPFCIDRLYGGCKVEKYLINLPYAEQTGKWILFIQRNKEREEGVNIMKNNTEIFNDIETICFQLERIIEHKTDEIVKTTGYERNDVQRYLYHRYLTIINEHLRRCAR